MSAYVLSTLTGHSEQPYSGSRMCTLVSALGPFRPLMAAKLVAAIYSLDIG